MDNDDEALRDAPPAVRAFFEKLNNPPDWVDFSAFIPGIRMFHRNSKLILGAFVGGTLVEGLLDQHQQVLLHIRASEGPGREAVEAEQPPHDRDLHAQRP